MLIVQNQSIVIYESHVQHQEEIEIGGAGRALRKCDG